jgi:hypothetical protein
MTDRTLADLVALRRLFEECQWTQGANARDARGRAVSDTAPDATCFCLVGGMNRVLKPDDGPDRYLELKDALTSCGVPDLVMFNDQRGRTKEDVLTLIESAIERKKECVSA